MAFLVRLGLAFAFVGGFLVVLPDGQPVFLAVTEAVKAAGFRFGRPRPQRWGRTFMSDILQVINACVGLQVLTLGCGVDCCGLRDNLSDGGLTAL